jgi:hypothetical protein
MLDLRTPEWGQQRGPAGRAVRAAVRLLARAVLVVATLMLLTFVTIGASQACSDKNNPTQSITQSAIHFVAEKSTATSSVVEFAVNSTAFHANGSGHCHGLACAGSCCAACSAGVIAIGWTVARGLAPQFDIPPLYTSLSSTELDAQFRPPRIIL